MVTVAAGGASRPAAVIAEVLLGVNLVGAMLRSRHALFLERRRAVGSCILIASASPTIASNVAHQPHHAPRCPPFTPRPARDIATATLASSL